MKKLSELIFSALFVIGLAYCKQDDKTVTDLKSHLPGEWEVESLRVQVNTADNTDSSYVFEAQRDSWIAKFQVKPFRTFYTDDNKYRIEYRTQYDSLISTSRGIWNVFGDTLMRIEPTATYQYTVKLQPGRLEYKSMVDWDGDGQEDDEYIEVQRFLKR